MLKFSFIVSANSNGKRLDKLVVEQLNDSSKINVQYSRQEVQDAIKNGNITIDDTIAIKKDTKLKTGQKVHIDILNRGLKSSTLKAINMDLNIVYEDEHLAIIDKPAGLVVHPGVGHIHDTLVNGLLAHYNTNLSTGVDALNKQRPGIVHRLDKDTSGLMLVAKNDRCALLLNHMFVKHEIKRVYYAVVHGTPMPMSAKIITNLAKSHHDPTKVIVSETRGKMAITTYKVVEIFSTQLKDEKCNVNYKRPINTPSFAFVECILETGRTHQIRVHMRFRGHPIVGDQKYSSDYNFNPRMLPKELAQFIMTFSRQALHARQLKFIHPISKQELVITSELPEDMQELLTKLQQIR